MTAWLPESPIRGTCSNPRSDNLLRRVYCVLEDLHGRCCIEFNLAIRMLGVISFSPTSGWFVSLLDQLAASPNTFKNPSSTPGPIRSLCAIGRPCLSSSINRVL